MVTLLTRKGGCFFSVLRYVHRCLSYFCRYKLKYSITTGGFRKLRNTYLRTQTYSGISEENSMEFWFDYDEPNHCTEEYSCTSNESPLQLEEDITKVN